MKMTTREKEQMQAVIEAIDWNLEEGEYDVVDVDRWEIAEKAISKRWGKIGKTWDFITPLFGGATDTHYIFDVWGWEKGTGHLKGDPDWQISISVPKGSEVAK